MNCAAAYPQDEGVVLMLGYGERSSPCRQRPSLHTRINSRSLRVNMLPKLISRPKDCFWFLGLMGFDLVYSVTGFHVTPVHLHPWVKIMIDWMTRATWLRKDLNA
jgi:hypothetical protein